MKDPITINMSGHNSMSGERLANCTLQDEVHTRWFNTVTIIISHETRLTFAYSLWIAYLIMTTGRKYCKKDSTKYNSGNWLNSAMVNQLVTWNDIVLAKMIKSVQ